ncbi:MAG: acyl-ACP--UDP-N-acetylglucosamine O-acyltransferase [Armatimonadetes bacterium]|nr:acyl-ACP--UDP-N-acetylglucosamine O-acyltransferase [Armatimonadota bacterium]MDW8121065.1 acyl-ACP--UDP-N-acetylglucosamine O-acyltransferase [Armatimonadota bacterium]
MADEEDVGPATTLRPVIEKTELLTRETKRIIHPTAVVSPKAELGEGVVVGPFAIVEDDVVIGDGTVLEPFVVVRRYTRLGRDNRIYTGTVLGGEPQDHKFAGERSYLIIGDRNIIREHVTIHRATGEDKATQIGDDNLIMAYCHIGHNCVLGHQISIASYSGISGHAHIESQVTIGGMTGIHQYVTIGKLAMIGGMSKVVQDVPPFMLADGRPAKIVGVNVVGLRRATIPPSVREDLHEAYRLLYRANLNIRQGLDRIKAELPPSQELTYLVNFIHRVSKGYLGRQRNSHR